MASPVAKLVQGRGVVFVRRVKVFLGWQVNIIGGVAVEGPVALVVLDGSAGSRKNAFRLFRRIPVKGLVRQFQRRHAVNLLRVEDVGIADDRPVQFHFLHERLAVLTENGLAVFVQAFLLFAELKIDHGRGLAAGQNGKTLFVGLLQRHPARIVEIGKAESHPVHAPVDRAGNRIVRHLGCFARMPWPLPGRGSGFKVRNDLFRKLHMERRTLGFFLLFRLIGWLIGFHGSPRLVR